ncbi:MAG: xanthine dehydrogenase family protein molybdopterin-binding subunit [Armatimonadota bacterium]
MSESLTIVGQPLGRVEGLEKVTGRARFVSDLLLPDMLHARILRSAHAHATLRRVDASGALTTPGVVAVLTGGDLRDIDPYYGPAYKDQPILAIDRVRYEGEPVAAVAAVDAVAADEAVERIEVEYEPLAAAATLDEALAGGAPLVHTQFRLAGHYRDLRTLRPIEGTNVCHQYHYRHGEGAQGLDHEAEVIVEDEFTFPAVQHVSLESFVAVAQWEGDRLTVWSGTQHPFPVRKELAEIFGLGQHQVRVIAPLIGGGFGQKCYTKLEPLAAALARRAGRPVRVALSLSDAFRTLTRHPARIWMRTGAKRDGTLVGRVVKMWLDTGAYADVGPRVTNKAGYRSIGPYRWRHVEVDAQAVHTHRVPAGAFRGYGAPQALWAGESQLNHLAERLDLDPVELRMRNLLARGEAYAPGDTPMDADLRQSLRTVADAVGWNHSSMTTGQGIAMATKDGGGTYSVSAAVVRLHVDGTATVYAGSVEIGQGPRTVFAQIVAEVLALPVHRVTVHEPDTDDTPYDQGTSASRSTTLTGSAVHEAARDVRAQLVELAQRFFEAPAEVISLENGVARAGPRAASYADLMTHHFGMPAGELVGRGLWRPSASEGSPGGATTFWEVGAGAAEVEVDEETGEVRVLKYATVADVGRAINARLCEGQDEGAAMQGLGHTLFEEMVFEDGQLLNPNLIDYRVPLISDLPEEFSAALVENVDGPGPFGSKGIGESGIIAPAPAVAAAVAAVTGVHVRALPLTPERVWRALRDRRR